MMQYDSLYLAIWDEEGTQEIQVVFTGKPSENLITASLADGVPSSYSVVVMGISSDGELQYHKIYQYAGDKYVGTTNVFSEQASFKVWIVPPSDTITEGSTAVFSAVADITQPLEYNWYLDGVYIPGANDSVLTLTMAGRHLNESRIQVRAGSGSGYVYSDIAGLTVTGAPSQVPGSPYPPDKSINQPLFVTLSWGPVIPQNQEPVTYDLLIDKGTIPRTIAGEGFSPNQFVLTNLEAGITYFWQVTARSGTDSVSGPVWSFTTKANPKGENTGPSMPVGPYPENNAVEQPLSGLQLSWTGGDPDGDAVLNDIYLSKENPPQLKIDTSITNTSASKAFSFYNCLKKLLLYCFFVNFCQFVYK